MATLTHALLQDWAGTHENNFPTVTPAMHRPQEMLARLYGLDKKMPFMHWLSHLEEAPKARGLNTGWTDLI